jgi:hypothetical protein
LVTELHVALHGSNAALLLLTSKFCRFTSQPDFRSNEVKTIFNFFPMLCNHKTDHFPALYPFSSVSPLDRRTCTAPGYSEPEIVPIIPTKQCVFYNPPPALNTFSSLAHTLIGLAHFWQEKNCTTLKTAGLLPRETHLGCRQTDVASTYKFGWLRSCVITPCGYGKFWRFKGIYYLNIQRRDVVVLLCILWRNRPMRSPSLTLSSLRVLLGYAVTAGSRNSREGPRDLSDVTLNSTRRCVLRMSDSSVYRRDWRQCSSTRVPVVFVGVQVRVRNREFMTSYRMSYRRELRRLLLWIEDVCVILGE